MQKYRDFTEVKRCHIMFVDPAMAWELRQYLAEHPGTAVVTVGESNGFARDVGMIEFLNAVMTGCHLRSTTWLRKREISMLRLLYLILPREVY